MEISKVYEDENLIVLNKPAGLIVHPKNATDEQSSVVSWLSSQYEDIEKVGEPFIASGTESARAGIVHRLDKDTSGLLVVAKNDETFYYLKSLFQTRKIQKHYYALVYGRPKEGHGIIDAPMGRIGLKRTIKLDGKKLLDSKPAITEYSIAKGYTKYSLIDVSPKTGRTHQIRVHLQSIGCPIVGDPVYGPKGWQKPEGLMRLFLHAYRLEFNTQDGKSLVLEAELPEDLQKVLSVLE
ncbi:MAG: RluA family pseudouridine synthase [Patescibacteria group bacterium]